MKLQSNFMKQVINSGKNNDDIEKSSDLKALKLSVGDTVSGEVLESEKNAIRLLVSKNTVIKALLNSELQLQTGKLMHFQVVSGNSSQIVLRPLYENLSENKENTIQKALEQAKIPEDEKTVKMVELLMKHNLPVDSKALSNWYKYTADFGTKELENTIIFSKNTGIEPSSPLIRTVLDYTNNVTDISKALEPFLNEGKNYSSEQDSNLKSDVLYHLIEDRINQNSPLIKSELNTLQQKETIKTEVENTTDMKAEKNANFEQEVLSNLKSLSDPASTAENEKEPKLLLLNLIEQYAPKNIDSLKTILEMNPELEKQFESAAKEVFLLNNSSLINQLQQEVPILDGIDHSLSNEEGTLLLLKNFELLLNNLKIANEGKEIGTEKKEDYRTVIEKILNHIDLFEKDTELKGNQQDSKNLSTLKTGMELLLQLSEQMHYYQIPFRYQGKNHNSELYVFKDKNRKKSSEDPYEVKIHLDMEHLGSVDINIKMLNKNLDLNFQFDSENTAEFMDTRMELLEKRLQAKGFLVKTSIQIEENDKSTLLDGIFQEKRDVEGIKHSSFDVRA